jgi:hypothetical protein
VLFVFAISLCLVHVYEEFGSYGSSLIARESFVVLGCRAWNALPRGMEFLPTWASFVSAVRRMIRGVDASN